MVRGPACATPWALEMCPKLPVMFMFGSPQLTMLNRLENCASYRRAKRSFKWNVLPADIEKVVVPGPSRIPTPQLPKRPMGSAVPAGIHGMGWHCYKETR